MLSLPVSSGRPSQEKDTTMTDTTPGDPGVDEGDFDFDGDDLDPDEVLSRLHTTNSSRNLLLEKQQSPTDFAAETPRRVERSGPDTDIIITTVRFDNPDNPDSIIRVEGFEAPRDYLDAAEARQMARVLIAAADELDEATR